jgi:hypothetical protein
MARTTSVAFAFAAALAGFDVALGSSNDTTYTPPTWLEKYGHSVIEPGFSGIVSFSHLPFTKCLEVPDAAFDIAILGMPFGKLQR